jgi:hypothetical protein
MQRTLTSLQLTSAKLLGNDPSLNNFAQYVLNQTLNNNIVFALVPINISIYRGLIAPVSPIVPHFVLILGVSSPLNTDKSYNWFKTYNPFNNQIEYYTEKDFLASVNSLTDSWFILTIGRTP